MEVLVTCNLDDKVMKDARGNSYKVLAHSITHVCPNNQGLGTMLMKWSSDYAEANGYDFVVGFCASDVVEFFRKCGYFISEKHYLWKKEDRVMLSDRRVPEDLIVEETW